MMDEVRPPLTLPNSYEDVKSGEGCPVPGAFCQEGVHTWNMKLFELGAFRYTAKLRGFTPKDKIRRKSRLDNSSYGSALIGSRLPRQTISGGSICIEMKVILIYEVSRNFSIKLLSSIECSA
jgi:hypothetical protein